MPFWLQTDKWQIIKEKTIYYYLKVLFKIEGRYLQFNKTAFQVRPLNVIVIPFHISGTKKFMMMMVMLLMMMVMLLMMMVMLLMMMMVMLLMMMIRGDSCTAFMGFAWWWLGLLVQHSWDLHSCKKFYQQLTKFMHVQRFHSFNFTKKIVKIYQYFMDFAKYSGSQKNA